MSDIAIMRLLVFFLILGYLLSRFIAVVVILITVAVVAIVGYGIKLLIDRIAKTEKLYYASGALRTTLNYKAGKLNGIAKSYYESGALSVEVNYEDGKQCGIAKGYYESGVLSTESNYKDDKLDGVSKGYHESGLLSHEIHYKDGEVIGISKFYDKSGALSTKANYKDDIKIGISTSSVRTDDMNTSKSKWDELQSKNIERYKALQDARLLEETKKISITTFALSTKANYKDDKEIGIPKSYDKTDDMNTSKSKWDELQSKNIERYKALEVAKRDNVVSTPTPTIKTKKQTSKIVDVNCDLTKVVLNESDEDKQIKELKQHIQELKLQNRKLQSKVVSKEEETKKPAGDLMLTEPKERKKSSTQTKVTQAKIPLNIPRENHSIKKDDGILVKRESFDDF